MPLMLNTLSDEELSKKIKQEEDILECIGELKSRHSGIFFKKLNHYSGIIEVEDLRENNLSFFYEVAKEYDSSRSQFNTFLGNKTFYLCQEILRKNKTFSEIDENHYFEIPKMGRHELYQYVLNSIEDEESKFIFEKHFEGMSFREIAEQMNGKYSSEWVRQKFNRVIERYKSILQEEIT